MRVTVVSPFALPIGVVHEKADTQTLSGSSPLQHLEIPMMKISLLKQLIFKYACHGEARTSDSVLLRRPVQNLVRHICRINNQ